MSTTIGRVGDASRSGGVRLGKYVLDETPLGMGGMAEVFRGRTVGAEGFERPVAVKRVLPDASRNPAFAEMFVAEAKLSSRLQHPNIVSVLDFDRDHEGRLYLVMELVDGRDLNDVIDSGRLPFSVVIYTLSEMLRGLGYAHDLPVGQDGLRGLVHRDVSPHNVLCSWAGAVKVSDFGIAKARAATAASASIVIKGKPAYMSPEQVSGAPLDGRSDLFAVGVMLWQMLTGEYLFAAGTTTETLGRVLFGDVPRPSTKVGGLPADLEDVAMRLLERQPDRRYATAEDAIEALLACRDAPRDGRRELEQLLVARFPQKAPIRTGQRQRGAYPATPGVLPQGTPAEAVPRFGTVPYPVASGDAGTAPATPVAVAEQRARRRVRSLVIGIGAGVVVVGGLVAAILAAAGGGTDVAQGVGDVPQDARLEAVTTDAASPDAAPPDAAPDANAPDVAPPVDAAPPAVDARQRSDRSRPSAGSHGGSSGSGGIHEIKIPDN